MPATKPVQMRFTAADLDRIDRLKDQLGVPTRTDAVRVAVKAALDAPPRPPKKIPAKPLDTVATV